MVSAFPIWMIWLEILNSTVSQDVTLFQFFSNQSSQNCLTIYIYLIFLTKYPECLDN